MKHYYSYNFFGEFLTHIRQDPDDCTRGLTMLSHATDSYTARWSGTRSFLDAMELAENTWEEGIKLLSEIQRKEASILEELFPLQGSKMEKHLDVIGDDFDIDAYIKKDGPEWMASYVNTEEANLSTKFQTFLVNCWYPSHVQPETIINIGAYIASVINFLETRGVKCSIYLVGRVTADHYDVVQSIRLKSFNDYLDVSQLTFSIAHPSMLRRLSLRFIELLSNGPDKNMSKTFINNSHGQPADLTLDKETVDNIFTEHEQRENAIYLPMICHNNPDKHVGDIRNQLKKIMTPKGSVE